MTLWAHTRATNQPPPVQAGLITPQIRGPPRGQREGSGFSLSLLIPRIVCGLTESMALSFKTPSIKWGISTAIPSLLWSCQMSIMFYDKVNTLLHKSQKRTLPPNRPSSSLGPRLIRDPMNCLLRAFQAYPGTSCSKSCCDSLTLFAPALPYISFGTKGLHLSNAHKKLLTERFPSRRKGQSITVHPVTYSIH